MHVRAQTNSTPQSEVSRKRLLRKQNQVKKLFLLIRNDEIHNYSLSIVHEHHINLVDAMLMCRKK